MLTRCVALNTGVDAVAMGVAVFSASGGSGCSSPTASLSASPIITAVSSTAASSIAGRVIRALTGGVLASSIGGRVIWVLTGGVLVGGGCKLALETSHLGCDVSHVC